MLHTRLHSPFAIKDKFFEEVKEIKEPTKGKIVTRKKFAEISLEKTKEMMNRYRSRDGKGIEIKIGG